MLIGDSDVDNHSDNGDCGVDEGDNEDYHDDSNSSDNNSDDTDDSGDDDDHNIGYDDSDSNVMMMMMMVRHLIGIGKMIVELCSAEILLRVCRYLSWGEGGLLYLYMLVLCRYIQSCTGMNKYVKLCTGMCRCVQ